jgi:hypothetical protein
MVLNEIERMWKSGRGRVLDILAFEYLIGRISLKPVRRYSLPAQIRSRTLSNTNRSGNHGLFPWGVKRPGCEADHSPPSSAEVKEWVELYFHSPNTPSWRGAQLKKKHRDNFTFTLPINRDVRLNRIGDVSAFRYSWNTRHKVLHFEVPLRN